MNPLASSEQTTTKLKNKNGKKHVLEHVTTNTLKETSVVPISCEFREEMPRIRIPGRNA